MSQMDSRAVRAPALDVQHYGRRFSSAKPAETSRQYEERVQEIHVRNARETGWNVPEVPTPQERYSLSHVRSVRVLAKHIPRTDVTSRRISKLPPHVHGARMSWCLGAR